MLKFFGIGCVVLACAGMGFLKSFQMSCRLKELKTLHRIFLLLRGAIQFGGEPLPEALEAIGTKVPEPFSGFLSHVAEQLRCYLGHSFSYVFEACMTEDLKNCCLTPEDKKDLIQTGEMLGYLDRSMQIQALDTYLGSLEQVMKDLHDILPERKKLYQSLGIMGGLLMGILLI